MARLQVYINEKQIYNQDFIEKSEDNYITPLIKLSDTFNNYYTIIMVDSGNPTDHSKNRYILHWLIINNDTKFKKLFLSQFNLR